MPDPRVKPVRIPTDMSKSDYQVHLDALVERCEIRKHNVRCFDCYDKGVVAAMRYAEPYWSAEWYLCQCDKAREVEDGVSADTCYLNAQGYLVTVADREIYLFRGDAAAFFADPQVFLLEHALNGVALHNPSDENFMWQPYTSIQWVRGDVVPEEWFEYYETGPAPTPEEELEELFA